MNFSLKTSFIPNKKKATFFKANYFFNINNDMLNHLERAQISPVPSLNEADYQAYNKIISAEGKWIGMSSELLPKSQSYSLKNKTLKLPGYTFEGWAKVRNRHNVLAHPNLRNKPNCMLDQLQLFIAPESIIPASSGNLKKNITSSLLGKSMTFMHNGHQSNILYATALKQFEMNHLSGTILKVCEALNKATSHQPKSNYLTITLSAGK